MCEWLLYGDAKEWGSVCCSDREVVDFEFYGLSRTGGVKNGVLCFGGVRDKEVAVEVADEVGEFGVGKCVELLFCVCGDDERGVVGICIYFGVGDGVENVVNVQEEEGGGEGTALWDSVCDGLSFGFGMLGVEGLLAIAKVGGEEGYCGWGEVEFVL